MKNPPQFLHEVLRARLTSAAAPKGEAPSAAAKSTDGDAAEETLLGTAPEVVLPSLVCRRCNVALTSPAAYRAHFREAHYSGGRPSASTSGGSGAPGAANDDDDEEEEEDDSSDSGDDSQRIPGAEDDAGFGDSDEDGDREAARRAAEGLGPLVLAKLVAEGSAEATPASAAATTHLLVHRVLLSTSGVPALVAAANDRMHSTLVSPLSVTPQALLVPGETWAVLMLSSGYFEAALFAMCPTPEDITGVPREVVASVFNPAPTVSAKTGLLKPPPPPPTYPVAVMHKRYNRYTTRRKQGGSQSAHDAKMGRAAQSVGAQLRRAGEKHLQEDINGLLTSTLWGPAIAGARRVFIACPRAARHQLFQTPGLVKGDPRVGWVPFPVERPSLAEATRVAETLGSARSVASPAEAARLLGLSLPGSSSGGGAAGPSSKGSGKAVRLVAGGGGEGPSGSSSKVTAVAAGGDLPLLERDDQEEEEAPQQRHQPAATAAAGSSDDDKEEEEEEGYSGAAPAAASARLGRIFAALAAEAARDDQDGNDDSDEDEDSSDGEGKAAGGAVTGGSAAAAASGGGSSSASKKKKKRSGKKKGNGASSNGGGAGAAGPAAAKKGAAAAAAAGDDDDDDALLAAAAADAADAASLAAGTALLKKEVETMVRQTAARLRVPVFALARSLGLGWLDTGSSTSAGAARSASGKAAPAPASGPVPVSLLHDAASRLESMAAIADSGASASDVFLVMGWETMATLALVGSSYGGGGLVDWSAVPYPAGVASGEGEAAAGGGGGKGGGKGGRKR